jgi:acyl dehydratase
MTEFGNLAVGTELDGPTKVLAIERLWAFSGGKFALEGWPSSNVHTDPVAAERVGLDTLAVSATQLQGHVCQMFVGWFGPSWLRTGSMDVKFIAVVPDGEQISYGARLTDKGDDQWTFDVWCKNSSGDDVLVGTATARPDRSA